jgi:hypothetical protein
VAAATTVAATTAAVAAATAATVIELRMMAAATIMSFPRMVDGEARTIAPATPTPVWRIAI